MQSDNFDNEFLSETNIDDVNNEINNTLSQNDSIANTSTLDYAQGLLKKNANSLSDWRVKELGLRFTLFGLAEIQAARIAKLSSLVYDMEGQVFSEDNIRNFQGDPRKQVEIYQMGVQSLREASVYVKQTVDSMDWDKVETQLLQAASTSTSSNSSSEDELIRKISNDILRKFSVDVNSK